MELCSFMSRKPELLFPLKMNYEFQSQHVKHIQHVKHYNLYFLSSQNGLKLLFRLQKLPNWRWIMNFHSMVFCKNIAIQQSWNRVWNQNYFLDCGPKMFSNYILHNISILEIKTYFCTVKKLTFISSFWKESFPLPSPQKCHKRGKTVGCRRGLNWEQKWVQELAGQLSNPLVNWSTQLVNPLSDPMHAPLPQHHHPSSKNIKEKRQWAGGEGIHWVQWESGGDSNRGAIALVTDHWSDISAFFIQFDFFFCKGSFVATAVQLNWQNFRDRSEVNWEDTSGKLLPKKSLKYLLVLRWNGLILNYFISGCFQENRVKNFAQARSLVRVD